MAAVLDVSGQRCSKIPEGVYLQCVRIRRAVRNHCIGVVDAEERAAAEANRAVRRRSCSQGLTIEISSALDDIAGSGEFLRRYEVIITARTSHIAARC